MASRGCQRCLWAVDRHLAPHGAGQRAEARTTATGWSEEALTRQAPRHPPARGTAW